MVGPEVHKGTKVYQVCYKTKLEIPISEFTENLSSLKANCKVKKMRVVTTLKTHVECWWEVETKLLWRKLKSKRSVSKWGPWFATDLKTWKKKKQKPKIHDS